MTAFEELGTEARDAAGADLERRSTLELVELMNIEDGTVPGAVAAARISAARFNAACAFSRSGRG